MISIIILLLFYNNDINLGKKVISTLELNFNISNISVRNDYLLELEIPCINLKEIVYDKYSELNSLDYHVKILDDSKINDNVYFLAGHSGNGLSSYFNKLSLMKVGDLIYIHLSDRTLCYLVDKIYFIDKIGYLEVDDNLFDVLFLITCSLEYVSKQLIVEAHLVL